MFSHIGLRSSRSFPTAMMVRNQRVWVVLATLLGLAWAGQASGEVHGVLRDFGVSSTLTLSAHNRSGKIFFAGSADGSLWRSDGTRPGTWCIGCQQPIGASVGNAARLSEYICFQTHGNADAAIRGVWCARDVAHEAPERLVPHGMIIAQSDTMILVAERRSNSVEPNGNLWQIRLASGEGNPSAGPEALALEPLPSVAGADVFGVMVVGSAGSKWFLVVQQESSELAPKTHLMYVDAATGLSGIVEGPWDEDATDGYWPEFERSNVFYRNAENAQELWTFTASGELVNLAANYDVEDYGEGQLFFPVSEGFVAGLRTRLDTFPPPPNYTPDSKRGEAVWLADGQISSLAEDVLLETELCGNSGCLLNWNHDGLLYLRTPRTNSSDDFAIPPFAFTRLDTNGNLTDSSEVTVAAVGISLKLATGTYWADRSFWYQGEVNGVQLLQSSHTLSASNRLFRTSGTPAGTYQLIPRNPQVPSSFTGFGWLSRLVELSSSHDSAYLDGDILFMSPGMGSTAIWRSDGTPEGTRPIFTGPLSTTSSSSPEPGGLLGGELFFALNGNSDNIRRLWRTDGTYAGTKVFLSTGTLQLAGSGSAGPQYVGWHDPRHLVHWQDALWFACDVLDEASWPQLPFKPNICRVNGQTSQTAIFLVHGSPVFNPRNITPTAGGLFFVDDGAVNPAPANVLPSRLLVVDSQTAQPVVIWPEDWTAMAGNDGSAGVLWLEREGQDALAAVRNGQGKVQLWRASAVTLQGAAVELEGATLAARVEFIASLPGGTVLLVQALGEFHARLNWLPAGALSTLVLHPLGGDAFLDGSDLIDARSGAIGPNGDVLFPGFSAASGWELWRTDGTPEGTWMVLDAAAGEAGALETSQLTDSAHLNGALFYAAGGPNTGVELWRTDGTAAGTFAVADIAVGPESASPRSFSQVGAEVWFGAFTPDEGLEMWSTDGTTEGTKQRGSLATGPSSGLPPEGSPTFLTHGRVVYFGEDPSLGREPIVVCGGCLISNHCYSPGAISPNESCAYCNPSRPLEWTLGAESGCSPALYKIAPTAGQPLERMVVEIDGAGLWDPVEVQVEHATVIEVVRVHHGRLRVEVALPSEPVKCDITVKLPQGQTLILPKAFQVAPQAACGYGKACASCANPLPCFDFDPCTAETCGAGECVRHDTIACCPSGQCHTCKVGGKLTVSQGTAAMPANVVDAQCALLHLLWTQLGTLGPAPQCMKVPHRMADLDCSGTITVTDIQLLILKVVSGAMPASIDSDGDGCADACANL